MPLIRPRYRFRFILWLLSGVLLSGLWLLPVFSSHSPAQASAPPAFTEGRTAYEQEDYPTAIALWESLLSQTRDPAQRVTLLNNLSLAYQAQGDWETAKTTIEESLALQGYDLASHQLTRDSVEPLRLAQSLDTFGQWYYLTGDTETAIALWQQAESYYTPTQRTQFPYWFENQLNQAQALQYLGYHLDAQQLLISLYSTLADASSLSADARVDLAISLGRILRLVGQLEPTVDDGQLSAVGVLKDALEKWASQVSRDRQSALHLELGNTYRVRAERERRLREMPVSGLGSDEDADTVAELSADALSQYQQAAMLATTDFQRVQAQLNELSFRIQLNPSASEVGNLARSLLSSLETLPRDRPGLQARLAFAHHAIALAQQASSQTPPQADLATLLANLTEWAKELDNPQLRGEAWGLLGHLYEVLGQTSADLEDALFATNQALSMTLNAQQPELNYRLQWQLGRILKQQEKMEAAIAAYQASVQTIQSLRRDLVILNPDVQFSFRDDIEPVYRELADLLLHSGDPTQDQLKQTRVVIDSLHLLEVENYLRRSCTQASLEEVDEVVREQDPTAAFLYTVVLGDTIDVIAKFADSEELRHHAVDALNKQQLDQKLYEFRVLLEEKTAPLFSYEDRLKETARMLYEYLIQPISIALETYDTSTLVFVLDDSFLQIPVGTLFNPETQRYLIEEYAIAATPSLQLLGPKPADFENTRVLAGIATEGFEDEEISFSPLPSLKQQADDIRTNTSQSEIFMDKEFTAVQFRQSLAKDTYPIIHLATHAKVSSQPENSFIVTGDFQKVRVHEMDDLIDLREQENPEPIELLFLSACNTAAGDTRAPMGIAGMTVAAGARSAIASLWYAEDKKSTQLVREFYEIWRENPTWTKAKVLQESQKTLIQSGVLEPVYWANYSLLGNWL